MSSSDTQLPTVDQLAAARFTLWHQAGEALLTFENLRSWINATGLVLFTPRSGQLPAPAPSMVEAVLGAPSANPITVDTEQAKSLLARLIAEGVAVPLNLLGTPGETPDFVASAAVFSYIFTLRGDKAWKQPPQTSGPIKVSPLALAAYTLLGERPAMSSYDLATQLGKEVTESAVLRALNELWLHLRVLPIPQPDGAATLWELTSARFTKLMKAGSNAGQPSALSALISLYLNTVVVASEEEIETFLSPLAARSRIRDVIHALMSARQLETIAIAGKTVLHVAGELPDFLAPAGSVVIDKEAAAEIAVEPVPAGDGTDNTPHITKFVAKPRKVGTGFIKKPTFGTRPPTATDRERRPFAGGGKPTSRPSGPRGAGPRQPGFTKPWQEEKAARLADSGSEGEQTSPRPPRPVRGGESPAYSRKPAFGARPGTGPAGDRNGGAARPPRRDFASRPEGASDDARPRKSFSKPRDGGFGGKPAFSRDRGDRSDSRPPRRDFGDARPPRRDFAAGAAGPERGGNTRPPRRDFAPRAGAAAERPAFRGPRTPGSFTARPPREGFGGERKPYFPREGANDARPPRPGNRPPAAAGTDRRARTEGPPFRKFDAPRRPSAGTYAGKPSSGKPGGFAGKKPFSKPAAKGATGKPAGTFDKFKNNAKPFGNRPPARKYRPEEGESSG